MWLDRLNEYNIYLLSSSPRRMDLLKKANINFSIIKSNKEFEDFPENIDINSIAEYISRKKLSKIKIKSKKDIIIAADTVVIFKNTILNKPKNKTEAIKFLKKLSGNSHRVITGVSIKTINGVESFKDISTVNFENLSNEEIYYYVNRYKPFDKAGAYGIQEWIGLIGIKSINGSYYNIMGLPVNILCKKLKEIINA